MLGDPIQQFVVPRDWTSLGIKRIDPEGRTPYSQAISVLQARLNERLSCPLLFRNEERL